MKKHRIFLVTIHCAFILCIMFGTGCKKWVSVDPPVNILADKDVYNNQPSAIGVLNGIYLDMRSQEGGFTGNPSLAISSGLSADEISTVALTGHINRVYYQNSFSSNKGFETPFWGKYYSYILRVNQAIEGLTASTSLKASVKQQLLGESKFLRAFFYFYLVNLYGDVPLITSTDPEASRLAKRAPVGDVYKQILSDLTEAHNDLNRNYLGATLESVTSERSRPNKATATALLARVYLFQKEWDLAESMATKIITESMYELDSLNGVFRNTSKEAIWQIESAPRDLGGGRQYFSTPDAYQLNLVAALDPPNGTPYLSSELEKSFEALDRRKHLWIDTLISGNVAYPFPIKYKSDAYFSMKGLPSPVHKENFMVFRLAEQYLIRAEARAELNRLGDAEDDINVIRTRAGLGNITATSQAELRVAILNERRAELFVEFGHRWFDLKRTGLINQVMSTATSIKGGTWAPYAALFPIPLSEFLVNPNLKGQQNPGYEEQ